jgi:hypothetical protein
VVRRLKLGGGTDRQAEHARIRVRRHVGAQPLRRRSQSVESRADRRRILSRLGSRGAAALCFGALGSDTAGSVRQPASYCGLTGLMPTYGRVSTRGVMPPSWSLDHLGPLCHTAADAALLFKAIAGYDALEPTGVDQPVERYVTLMLAKPAR